MCILKTHNSSNNSAFLVDYIDLEYKFIIALKTGIVLFGPRILLSQQEFCWAKFARTPMGGTIFGPMCNTNAFHGRNYILTENAQYQCFFFKMHKLWSKFLGGRRSCWSPAWGLADGRLCEVLVPSICDKYRVFVTDICDKYWLMAVYVRY